MLGTLLKGFSFTPIPYHRSLNKPLLRFGKDRWCIRDACEGVQIFGGIGSGKTSGSGRALAHAYLKAGMGGLVLCAKPDEADLWRRYAKETKREDSLVFMDHTASIRFNFLDYAQATVAAEGFSHNLVDMMARISEAAAVADTRGGSDDNPFFRDTAMQLLSHTFPLLQHVYGRLRLRDAYTFIQSAPKSRQEAATPQWQQQSYCAKTVNRLVAMATKEGDAKAARLLDEHSDYWIAEFPTLGDKTRGSVVATLTSTIYPFLSDRLYDLFCTSTNLVPELTREGAIIVLDLPALKFGKGGVVAQQIVKYLWQMSMERQKVTRKTRPVFLWADEAQFFMNSHDARFLGTARSAKTCPVFITQDLPNYYAHISGDNAKDTADAIIGKFQTRIFHATTDIQTCNYASEIIGKVMKEQLSRAASDGRNQGMSGHQTEEAGTLGGGAGRNVGDTRTVSEYQDWAVPPDYFGQSLRIGGPKNKYKVDGILVRNGRIWKSNKKNHIKAVFSQK